MKLIRFPPRPKTRKPVAPRAQTHPVGLTIHLDADKILAAVARLKKTRKDDR